MAMKIEQNNFEESSIVAEHITTTKPKEPDGWTALWWSKARHELENADPNTRTALLTEMQIAIGQAISAFWDKSLQAKYINKADVYFAILCASLGIKYDPRPIEHGIICGVFTDTDPIPPFLAEAWEAAKAQIIEIEEPEIPELPEEAGNISSFYTDSEGTLLHLPIHIFPEALQSAITEISETKSVHQDVVIAGFIALASACIGRTRGVKYRKDWREHANLYMLLVSETGSGKSHTLDYIFKEVREIEARQKAAFKIARRQYEEDMILFRKSKDAGKIPPKRPPNIQFLLDDTTLEAVSERLEDNPRGLFWKKDEFASFFAALDKYAKGGASDGKNRLLQAWSVGPWSSSRKTKDGDLQERFIPHGCIGMFGNVQPRLLNSIFTKEDIDQGLPQRFLYLNAKIEKPMLLPTPDISDETENLIRRITEKLLSLELEMDNEGVTRTAYLTLTDEAKLVFEHFNNLMQTRSFGHDSIAFTAKMSNIVLRLSLILHFLKWACVPMNDDNPESYCSDKIQYATMSDAAKLANAFYSHTQYIRTQLPKDGIKKETSKKVLDEKKAIVMKFVLKNADFCSVLRGAQELIDKGLAWEGGNNSLGRYLRKFSFKRTPDGAKNAKFQLNPLPADFTESQ